ncbi:MAG: DUF4344 domain-containing metallopeptidase, partial [Pseudomonadota bacterium]
AIIDLGLLPVLGQEEDAVDALSVVLIDEIYEEESATEIMDSVVAMWALSAGEDAPVYWEAHDPDLRRLYSHVCLFAGLDLEAREDWALDAGLPEERLEPCEEEAILAAESWQGTLAEMEGEGDMRFVPWADADDAAASLADEVVGEEVAWLNEGLALPEALEVRVEPCGEENAFYDPGARAVIICTEYARWHLDSAPQYRRCAPAATQRPVAVA